MNKKNISNKNLRKVSGGANELNNDSRRWNIICKDCLKILEDGLTSEEEAKRHVQGWHDEGSKCPWCQGTDFRVIEN